MGFVRRVCRLREGDCDGRTRAQEERLRPRARDSPVERRKPRLLYRKDRRKEKHVKQVTKEKIGGIEMNKLLFLPINYLSEQLGNNA